MRSLSAAFRLIRWENALIAAAGVLLGAWWVGGNAFGSRPILAALAAIALAAVANAHNDLVDIEIDRTAHPNRPLPSGALSPVVAQRIVWVAAGMSLVLALLAHPALGALTVVVIGVMIAYSRRLKPLGMPGNFTVALLASLPFLYGGWSVGRPRESLVLVAIAIPLHLAREIAKDMEDAGADAATRQTLPVAAGKAITRSMLLAAVASFFFVLGAFVKQRPEFAVGILPAVLFVGIATWRAIAGLQGGPLLFKTAMVTAMASLILVREQWIR
jgi:geranylgeranylglycerol-phosphate geranylgeranyltransferase